MPEMRVTLRAMKFVAISLLAFVLAGLLAACDTPAEEKQFYYRGWMKPEKGSTQRMYGKSPDGSSLAPPGE